MKSQLLELELIILKTGYLVLLLNSFLFLYSFYFRNWLSKPIYQVYQFIGAIFYLAVLELILIKFILIREFKYFEKVNDFLSTFGIKTYDFISPPNYLIKFIFLGLFFSQVFVHTKVTLFYKYLIPILVIFESIMIFYFKSYQSYDSLSSTVKNIFILSGSGLLLFKIYKADISNISLYKNTYFWIAFALFITALTELFLEFIFTKLHDSDLIGFYKLYLVRNALQVMFFLLMIVGFLNAKYLKYLPEKY